ncbi:hypothetical protein D3C81_1330640 [compost metagenome]
MNLEELAGQFAGECSYATFEEPVPPMPEEPKDPLAGLLTVGYGATRFGKSMVMAHMMDKFKEQMALVGKSATIMVLDSYSDMEAEMDGKVFEKLLGGIGVTSTVRRPEPRKPLINTSEKDAHKRKTRGQKHPGVGWGKRK